MNTAWFYLILAGLFEIGWPLGFKLSQVTSHRILFIAMAAVCMGISGYFMWMAQRDIPMGTVYAVWTGIGAAGTFVVGILFFKDPVSWMRMFSVFLIIAGVIGMKLAH